MVNRCFLFGLISLLVLTQTVFVEGETTLLPQEPAAPQLEVDYTNYYSLSGVPFDQWNLDKIDWNNPAFYNSPAFDAINFNDDKLYQMGSFSDFLFNLPETHYSKINAVKAIDNDHGNKLDAKMIEANDDEKLLVQKLNPEELNAYAAKKYKIDTIDASRCWPESCTLEKGMLNSNWKGWITDDAGNFIVDSSGKKIWGKKDGQVTLSTLQNTKAKIAVTNHGEIVIIIDVKGNAEETAGAKWTEEEPIQINKQDKFYLTASKLVSEQGVWIQGKQQYHLFAGEIYFEKGEMYISPIKKDEDYVIIDHLKIKVFQPTPLKITSEPPSNVFSKELYLGEGKIIATGADYRVSLLSGNRYVDIDSKLADSSLPSLLKQNEEFLKGKNFFGFQLEGDTERNIPSKIIIAKKVDEEGILLPPEVSLAGRVKIQNGYAAIQADGNHFVSLPWETPPEGELEKPYFLTDMEIYYEKQPDNRLLIEENRIKIGGKKTTYLSAEYNENGRIDISLQLGELEKGKVKRPALFVYTPLSKEFDAMTGENLELEEWETGIDLVNLNKGDDLIPITIYLGSEYSLQTSDKRKNEEYLLDFLSAAKKSDFPTFFLGHSGVDYDEGTAYILANNEKPLFTPTAQQLADPEFVKEFMKNDPRMARIPLSFFEGRDINNPIFCGCASGSLLHEGESGMQGISGVEALKGPHGEPRVLTAYESLAVLTFSTMKAKNEKDYNWQNFKQDWNAGKVRFPQPPEGCKSFTIVRAGLETLNTGVSDWGGNPFEVCVD